MSTLGSFTLRRQRKKRDRWAGDAPEYDAAWKGRFWLPEKGRVEMSCKLAICKTCMADPTGRETCRCQRDARKWCRKKLAELYEEYRKERVEPAATMAAKEPQPCPTIGELIERYLAGVPETMQAGARKNAHNLRMIVAEATGGPPGGQAATVLTRQLAINWSQLRQQQGKKTIAEAQSDQTFGLLPPLVIDQPRPENNTINSMLGHARAIIGTKARSYYLGTMAEALPDLAGFSVSKLPATVGHVALTEAELAPIRGMAADWKAAGDEKWIAFVLMAGMGLRPIEVLAVQGHWLEDAQLVVMNRPGEFTMKDKTTAKVTRYATPPAFRAAVEGREGHLFAPGLTKTARAEKLGREMSADLRAVLPDRCKKTLYQLRKWFGSALAASTGIEAAAAGLRHSSSKTSEKYYVDSAEEIPCLIE
jgi:hypothetical protein